jgi:hypothetical protein
LFVGKRGRGVVLRFLFVSSMRIMRQTHHPYPYDYKAQFPNLRRVWAGGFEQVYFAEGDDAFYLIYDGRLVVDMMVAAMTSASERKTYEQSPELRFQHPLYHDDGAIQVIAFDSVGARSIFRSGICKQNESGIDSKGASIISAVPCE